MAGRVRALPLLLLVVSMTFLATSSSSMAMVPKAILPDTVKDGNLACCDQCICHPSYPPKCRCMDVKTSCHAACKHCLCTKSIPPQCQCGDVLEYCFAPCKPCLSEYPRTLI